MDRLTACEHAKHTLYEDIDFMSILTCGTHGHECGDGSKTVIPAIKPVPPEQLPT
ncbi:hypothetical protein M405DRAFT_817853 [Rhizopogon salebrosus TDB-379]|nr:hypothetical protein M405DRAFT_817853 [Rhizopogon salebrosus TDB-379]